MNTNRWIYVYLAITATICGLLSIFLFKVAWWLFVDISLAEGLIIQTFLLLGGVIICLFAAGFVVAALVFIWAIIADHKK